MTIEVVKETIEIKEEIDIEFPFFFKQEQGSDTQCSFITYRKVSSVTDALELSNLFWCNSSGERTMDSWKFEVQNSPNRHKCHYTGIGNEKSISIDEWNEAFLNARRFLTKVLL